MKLPHFVSVSENKQIRILPANYILSSMNTKCIIPRKFFDSEAKVISPEVLPSGRLTCGGWFDFNHSKTLVEAHGKFPPTYQTQSPLGITL